MKNQTRQSSAFTRSADPEETVRLFTRRVRYQFTLCDGTVCHSTSVVMSATRDGLRSAYRRFWQTNSHVSPEVA